VLRFRPLCDLTVSEERASWRLGALVTFALDHHKSVRRTASARSGDLRCIAIDCVSESKQLLKVEVFGYDFQNRVYAYWGFNGRVVSTCASEFVDVRFGR
jgi:hypothetical protein